MNEKTLVTRKPGDEHHVGSVRLGQTRSELVLDLKDLRRNSLTLVGAWSGLAPDGSALFVRDLSTDEIYSLDLELP